MVDTVFTRMRCERTALDVSYDAGAPPIVMRGTEFVSPVRPAAAAIEFADIAGEGERAPEDSNLHEAVDPPAYAPDAADAPGPQVFADVCCHPSAHKAKQTWARTRTHTHSLMWRRTACCG